MMNVCGDNKVIARICDAIVKNKWTVIFSVFLIVVIGYFCSDGNKSPQMDEAKLQKVVVRKIVSSEIEDSVCLRGKATAWIFSTIRSNTHGTVSKIQKDRGDFVDQGTSIVSLSQEDRNEVYQAAQSCTAAAALDYEASKKLVQSSYKSKFALASAKYKYDSALAQEKAAKLQVEYANILAPFQGVVNDRFVSPGDLVSPGDKIVTFSQMNPMRVVVYCNEKFYESIKPGQNVEVEILGRKIAGVIDTVCPYGDEQTRAYRIDIKISNEDCSIADGMTADVRIILGNVKAHKIPSSAICLDDDGNTCIKILGENNKSKILNIEIARFESDHVVVKNLPDSIAMIVVGQDYIVDGEVVEPAWEN